MAWYWVALIVIYGCCFAIGFVDSLLAPTKRPEDFVGAGLLAIVGGILGPLVVLDMIRGSLRSRRLGN